MDEHEHAADMRTLELLGREVGGTRYRAACRVDGCEAFLADVEPEDVDCFGDWGMPPKGEAELARLRADAAPTVAGTGEE